MLYSLNPMVEALLKPEATKEREDFLRHCHFSEEGIKKFEGMSNQKEKAELLAELLEIQTESEVATRAKLKAAVNADWFTTQPNKPWRYNEGD